MSRRSRVLAAAALALASASVPVVSSAQAQPAPAGMIDVTVFDDLDRDGVLDPGEPPVSGSRIDVFDTATTDSGPGATTGVNGRAIIADIAPGEYEISWSTGNGVDPGWTTPRAVTVTVTDGETVSVEFGAAFRTISGTAFFDIDEDLARGADEPPAPGVLLEVFTEQNPPTTTGDDGTFTVSGAGTFVEIFVAAPDGFAAVNTDSFGSFGGPLAASDVLIYLEAEQCAFDAIDDVCVLDDLGIDIPIVPLEYDLAITAEATSAFLITGFTADITLAGSSARWVNPNEPIRVDIPTGLTLSGHFGPWDVNEFESGQFEFYCFECAPTLGPLAPLTLRVIADTPGNVTVTAFFGTLDGVSDEFFGVDVSPTDNTASVDFTVIDRLPDTR